MYIITVIIINQIAIIFSIFKFNCNYYHYYIYLIKNNYKKILQCVRQRLTHLTSDTLLSRKYLLYPRWSWVNYDLSKCYHNVLSPSSAAEEEKYYYSKLNTQRRNVSNLIVKFYPNGSSSLRYSRASKHTYYSESCAV